MLRIPLILSVWSLAALPALAAGQIALDPPSAPSTLSRSPATSSSVTTAVEAADRAECNADAPEAGDPAFIWRLRAYRHLDCVIGLVEEAMRRGPDEGGKAAGSRDEVRLSRTELEQIRTLAFWARDAAARIGR